MKLVTTEPRHGVAGFEITRSLPEPGPWILAGAIGGLVAAAAAKPPLLLATIGLTVALVLITAVARNPVLGARIMVIGGPLLAGFERGRIAGPLRANELLLALVLIGVISAYISGWNPSFRWHPADTAIAVLFGAGVVLPILFAFGRDRGPSFDDILSTMTLAKGCALYVLFRVVHESRADLYRTVTVTISVAVALSVVAVFDALNIGGVANLLDRIAPSGSGPSSDDNRASATIANPIGFGGYLVMHLALALPLALGRTDPRVSKRAMASVALLSIGILATGQISVWLSAAVVTGLVAILGRYRISRKKALAGLAVALMGVALLWPVAQRRTEGFGAQAIPSEKLNDIASLEPHRQPLERYYADPGSSWDVRWHNLQTYFLPDLLEPENLILGVRPLARVVPDEPWFEFVWIESGAVWLLYVGGVPLLGAFMFLVWRLLQMGRREPTASAVRSFAVTASGIAAALAVLMLFDPHLTLRGTSDALYPILGICVVACALSTLDPTPDVVKGGHRR